MIRINLMPVKRRAERGDGSQLWLAVVMVVMLAEVAALFVFHGFKSEELKDQQRKNTELSAQIDQSKNAVARNPPIPSINCEKPSLMPLPRFLKNARGLEMISPARYAIRPNS